MGLVRSGEVGPGGRPAVQLAPRGRYVLGLGPPPPPPPKIEQFLFVQPNFEIVAYRQGLNPALVGRLSRFARWEQLGAALTLRLDARLGGPWPRLGPLGRRDPRMARPPRRPTAARRSRRGDRHLGRPPRAADLLWLGDADRVRRLRRAGGGARRLAGGPAARRRRVAERVLLVEDEATIPFRHFRLAGARDYRRPPEACVEVGPDGVSLTPTRPRRPLRRGGTRADSPIRCRSVPGRRRVAPPPATSSRPIRSAGRRPRGSTDPALDQWFERPDRRSHAAGRPAALPRRSTSTATGARLPFASTGRSSCVAARRSARRPPPAPEHPILCWVIASGRRPPSSGRATRRRYGSALRSIGLDLEIDR